MCMGSPVRWLPGGNAAPAEWFYNKESQRVKALKRSREFANSGPRFRVVHSTSTRCGSLL